MNRPLHSLIELALVAAVGCMSAYGVLYLQGPQTGRVPTPTIALVATTGAPLPPSAPPAGAAISYPSGGERPAGIVSYRDAVARAAPSVVTVHWAHVLKGRLPLSPAVVVRGLGSGVIIDRDGYIVTNYHVVHDASDRAVALADGKLQLTRIVGVYTESDIALLKLGAEDLRPIALTDMNEVSVGDVALAVLAEPDGPADHAEFAPGDVIVRVGERPVSRPTDVRSIVVGAEPGTHVPVEFVR